MIDPQVDRGSVRSAPNSARSDSPSAQSASDSASGLLTKARDASAGTPSVSYPDSVDGLTAKVARGSTWVLVGSVFGRVVQFAIHILLSRVLGAYGYGLYAMGRSVMHFMQQLGGLGLPAGVVRFGAAQRGQGDLAALKGTLIASFLIGTIASAVIGAILFIGAGWMSVRVFNEPEFTPVLRVFSVSLPFFMLNFLASRVARAFQSMKHDVAIGTIAQPTINLLLVAIAFALGYRLGGAVYAFLVAMIISAVVGLYLVTRLFPELFSKVHPVFSLGKLMKYSLTVLGAGLSTLLLGETDRIMLGILASAADVGVYNVAVLVSTQIVFFLTAVNSSFMPMIADLYHRNCRTELRDLFRTTTRWVFMFSLPLFLILLLFPAPVLSVFGTEFAAAAPALTILALAYFIDAAVGSVGFLLQMSDYHYVLAINNVVMAILNIALNFWLITAYGITGAAVATGLAIASINIVKLIEVRVLLDMQPYDRRYWKPIVAGIVAALAGLCSLYFLPQTWNWVVGICSTLVAYGGMLFLFGAEQPDRLAVQSLLVHMMAPSRRNGSDNTDDGRDGIPL